MDVQRTRPSKLSLVSGLALLMTLSSCDFVESDIFTEKSNVVTGTVNEWFQIMDAHRASTGLVIFRITNVGNMEHEFQVIKTHYRNGGIPLVDNKISGDSSGIEVVDEMKKLASGETRTMSVDLSPGAYQLVCNIFGHYSAGMYSGFTVE